MDKVQVKAEIAQSAISYGSGGGLLAFASLADLANAASQVAIILGCLVVAIRLVHDAVALFRFLKKKPNDKG